MRENQSKLSACKRERITNRIVCVCVMNKQNPLLAVYSLSQFSSKLASDELNRARAALVRARAPSNSIKAEFHFEIELFEGIRVRE